MGAVEAGGMKNEPTPPPAQAIALERYALIAQIQDRLHQGIPLAAALEQVACCPVTRPDGTQRFYARRTIEDWYYAHQQGGFAALSPKTRSDKGQPRILTPEQSRWVLEQAQAHLAVPVKVLYRRWRQQDPQLPSLPSIYRLLREHELHAKARRQQRAQPLAGPTKCFEAPAVNDLWMVDFSPGPYLHPPGSGQAIPTHLCLIIDDHSRLLPFAAYYLQADTQSFHHTLKEAIRRRGLPLKLYTDQGGPFTNDHTRIVCARLGIRLLHAKPFHSWSKGKAERMFFTIQQDFEASLRLPGEALFTLAELNAKFSTWLEIVYHQRVHSSTNMTPTERYQRGAHLVRAFDPHLDLDLLFYAQVTRTVRRDGTVRLDNHLYEVDLALRTLSITLRFDPFKLDRIEVYHRGASFGLAKPVDAQLNSQITSTQAYEKRSQP
jgi:transposase InsO family protein